MAKRIGSLFCGLAVVSALTWSAAAGERVPAPPRTVAREGKHSKISGELREWTRQRASGVASTEAGPPAVQVVIETSRDTIAAVQSHVLAAGGTFERSAGNLVLATLPVSALETVASSSEVNVIRRPRAPTPFQTTSEGVNAIGAATWHAAGRKGQGVKIAILDVGFQDYEYLMGSELPNIPASHVRSFSGDISGNSETHGTGVAEIVYDIAPNADFYLVNFSNDVELENAVQWLIDEHVDVINTSWGYPCGGPLNGTGFVNGLVQRAAAAGIIWVTAAGNFAQQHWSGTFNDSNGNLWHNFAASEDGNTVYMSSGDELRVCVEWDDWASKDQDFDLYIWDEGGNVVDSSTEDQSGPNTNDPFELVTFTAGATGNYFIGVKRDRGTRNPRMHMFAYPPGAECAIETAVARQPSAKGLLGEFRQFRDDVLERSPLGKQWSGAYYRHSPEVARILLLHPRLAIEAASLLNASRPAVRSVIAVHSGDSRAERVVISAEYAARVDAFLDALSALATPRLRNELDAVRAKALLSAGVGQTADSYWEGLLGRSPLEFGLSRTWRWKTVDFKGVSRILVTSHATREKETPWAFLPRFN
jgi:hypothetical protein